MKKILISVAALSLVVVMGVMLAACSKDNKNNSAAAGKYELYSMTIEGQELKDGELFDGLKANLGTIELTKDGKVISNGNEIAEWKQDGKKVTIGTEEYTLDGDTLTGEYEGAKIVLKKVE